MIACPSYLSKYSSPLIEDVARRFLGSKYTIPPSHPWCRIYQWNGYEIVIDTHEQGFIHPTKLYLGNAIGLVSLLRNYSEKESRLVLAQMIEEGSIPYKGESTS